MIILEHTFTETLMRTKTTLTTSQRDAIKRAIYLLQVAAFSDIVQEDATAMYDGVECDGYCFKDDSNDAADILEEVFGPLLRVRLW